LLDTETDKFETTILEMKLRGEQQESCNTSGTYSLVFLSVGSKVLTVKKSVPEHPSISSLKSIEIELMQEMTI